MRITALSILALLLTACGERIAPTPTDGDTHALPPIEWRIRSRVELEAIYRHSGMALHDGQKLEGFAGREGDRWVVYTLPPQYVDDAATCTLGHEVMHVALGDYHRSR